MYCKYCGSELEDGAVFCGVCGGRQVLDPVPVDSAPMPSSTQGNTAVSRPAKRVAAEAGSVSGTYTSAKKKSSGIRTKEINTSSFLRRAMILHLSVRVMTHRYTWSVD